jgi:hypothetical protein
MSININITNSYHQDLKAARAAGIKFSKQPTKVALYEAIAAFNPLATIDSTMAGECEDDEHLGTLSQPTPAVGQSPAIVMIVIILVVLAVVTRVASLGLALMVMGWKKLQDWYHQPVSSINYFPEILEVSPWN